MTPLPTREALATIIEPILGDLGLDLEDVSLARLGARFRLLVLVDRDGGVTLDECAEASTHISDRLDQADPFGASPYVLEVSSPGTSRPLVLPRHWRRNAGRLVLVTRRSGQSVTGRIRASDGTGATMDVAGRLVRVDFTDVAKAVVQVEFRLPSDDAPDGLPPIEAETGG